MNDPVVAYLFLGAVAWLAIVGAYALVNAVVTRIYGPEPESWEPGDLPEAWWR